MSFLGKLATSIGKMARKTTSFEMMKNIAPNEIGVYIFKLNGRVKYVGRAIEQRPNQSPSGLRKRLQEHWRGASTGKPEVYQYRKKLTVSWRICESIQQAAALEARLIREYDTVRNGWNLRYED